MWRADRGTAAGVLVVVVEAADLDEHVGVDVEDVVGLADVAAGGELAADHVVLGLGEGGPELGAVVVLEADLAQRRRDLEADIDAVALFLVAAGGAVGNHDDFGFVGAQPGSEDCIGVHATEHAGLAVGVGLGGGEGSEPVNAVHLFTAVADAGEVDVADDSARLDASDEVEVGELLHILVHGRGEIACILGRESDYPLEAVIDVLRAEHGELQEVGAVVEEIEVDAAKVGVFGVDGVVVEELAVPPLGLEALTVTQANGHPFNAGQVGKVVADGDAVEVKVDQVAGRGAAAHLVLAVLGRRAVGGRATADGEIGVAAADVVPVEVGALDPQPVAAGAAAVGAVHAVGVPGVEDLGTGRIAPLIHHCSNFLQQL